MPGFAVPRALLPFPCRWSPSRGFLWVGRHHRVMPARSVLRPWRHRSVSLPIGLFERRLALNGLRDRQRSAEGPYCPRSRRPPVWHIERCRNVQRQKQYFGYPTWSSRKMQSFTGSLRSALRNHTVMPSTNSLRGTALSRVWRSTELWFFAAGFFSNRRTSLRPPSTCAWPRGGERQPRTGRPVTVGHAPQADFWPV